MEKYMRYLIWATLALLVGCDFIGGGDTVIRGNDNLVVTDAVGERVAASLAKFDSTPQVTDEEIRAVYGVIRERAMAGDLDAVLVLLNVAERQRAPKEEEDED